MVTEQHPSELQPRKVAIYARVSSHEQKENLGRQVERLMPYCNARGYQVAMVVKEIASGVNDSRPKLLALLKDESVNWSGHDMRDARQGSTTRYSTPQYLLAEWFFHRLYLVHRLWLWRSQP